MTDSQNPRREAAGASFANLAASSEVSIPNHAKTPEAGSSIIDAIRDMAVDVQHAFGRINTLAECIDDTLDELPSNAENNRWTGRLYDLVRVLQQQVAAGNADAENIETTTFQERKADA